MTTPLVDEALDSKFMQDSRSRKSVSEYYPSTSSSFQFDFERSNLSRLQLLALIQQVG